MIRREFLARSIGGGLAMAATGLMSSSTTAADGPVVVTAEGRLQGAITPTGIHVFKGIPFAAPPIGANPAPRTEAPGAVGRRSECSRVRPQTAAAVLIRRWLQEFAFLRNSWFRERIVSPSTSGHRMSAVPGCRCWSGSREACTADHATGASPWYDGSAFARDGVVLVSINYRVGAEDSCISATVSPTSDCLINSLRSAGCRRTSPPSAAIHAR